LILGAKDMRIINGKGIHAEKPMQHA